MNINNKQNKRLSLTSTLGPFKISRAVPAATTTVKPINNIRTSLDNTPRGSSTQATPRSPLVNKPLAALTNSIAAASTPGKRPTNVNVSSSCVRGLAEEKEWEEILVPAKKHTDKGKENGNGSREYKGGGVDSRDFRAPSKPDLVRFKKTRVLLHLIFATRDSTEASLSSSATATNKAVRNPTTATKGTKAARPIPKVVSPVRMPSPLRQISTATTTTPPSVRTRAPITSPRGSSTVIGVTGHVKAKAQTIEAVKVKEISPTPSTSATAPAGSKDAPEALVQELKVQLRNAGKANKDLSQELSTLMASKASVENDNARLRANLEHAESRAASMAKMVLEKRARIKAMEEQEKGMDASFRTALKDFRTGVADFESQIEDLQADATIMDDRIEELENEVDQQASRVASLEEGQDEWIAYSSEVSARILAREQEVTELEATVADKENELGFLRLQQKLAESDINDLHEQGSDLIELLEAAQEACECSETARREEILAFASTATAFSRRAREAEAAQQISELRSLGLEIDLEQSIFAHDELGSKLASINVELAANLATSAAEILESKDVISTLNETVRAAHTEIDILRSKLVELAPTGTVIAVEEYSAIVAEKEELTASLEQHIDERDGMLALKDEQMEDLLDRKFRDWEKLKEAELELEDARTAHQRSEELLKVAQTDAARLRDQANFLSQTSRTLRDGLLVVRQELAEAKAQADTLKANVDIISASNLALGEKLESAQLSVDIAQEEKAEADFAHAQLEALAEDLARALEESREETEGAEGALQALAGTAAKFIPEAERFQFLVTEIADTEVPFNSLPDPASRTPALADNSDPLLSIDPYKEELEHLVLFNGRLQDQLECETASSSCAQRSVVRLLEELRELKEDRDMYESIADDFSERWAKEREMRLELEAELDEDRFVYLAS